MSERKEHRGGLLVRDDGALILNPNAEDFKGTHYAFASPKFLLEMLCDGSRHEDALVRISEVASGGLEEDDEKGGGS